VHERSFWRYPEAADITRLRRLSENKPDLRRRGSESTLLTQSGAWPGRNPALQRGADLILDDAVCCHPPWLGPQMHFDRLKRREFMTLLGGVAASVGSPYPTRAQQATKVHHLAIVHPSAAVEDMNESSHLPTFPALFKELRRLNYVEGRNLAVGRYTGKGRLILPAMSWAPSQMLSSPPPTPLCSA
jgi:hypothetical protein